MEPTTKPTSSETKDCRTSSKLPLGLHVQRLLFQSNTKPMLMCCVGMLCPRESRSSSSSLRRGLVSPFALGCGIPPTAFDSTPHCLILAFRTNADDQGLGKVAVPCARHANLYPGLQMPKTPDWGVNLPGVMGLSSPVDMTLSNSKFVPRVQTLAGIDEMVRDLGERG